MFYERTCRWLCARLRWVRLGSPARESVARVTMELWERSREVRESKPVKAPSSTFSTAFPSRLSLVRRERGEKVLLASLLMELRERSRVRRLGGKRSKEGGERESERRLLERSREER